MKKNIQCAKCKEILGVWDKEEFELQDAKLIADSFACTLGHPHVILVDQGSEPPEWEEPLVVIEQSEAVKSSWLKSIYQKMTYWL